MFIEIRIGNFLKLTIEFLMVGDATTNVQYAVALIQIGLWIMALLMSTRL